MRPSFSLLACLLALPLGIATAEPELSIGGGMLASSALDVSPGGDGDYGFFRLSPLAVASGSIWEFRLGLTIDAGSAPPRSDISLAEAEVQVWIGDRLSFALGYGLDAGKAAEVFPLTAFFGPADPLSRFESGGGSLRREAEARAQLSFSGSFWRLSLACAPFRPPLVVPSLDSPWFPQDTFPDEITIFSYTYSFAGASYSEVTDDWPFEFEPSYLAEFDLMLGVADIQCSYFRGLERQASYVASVRDNGYEYTVELRPVRAVMDAFALSATATLGLSRFWVEAALFHNISFSTGSVEYLFDGLYLSPDDDANPFTEIPPIVNIDRYALTLGASRGFSLCGLGGRAFIESTYSWYPDAPETSGPPDLSRALAFGLDIPELPANFGVAFSGLISFQDWSSVLEATLSFNLGGDRSLEAAFPIFMGSDGTELGCYRDKRFFIIGYREHF